MTQFTLTANTAVPSSARGTLRAFVKQQPGWMVWIAQRGIQSREAKNSHLLEFAIEKGLQFQVETILSGGHTAPQRKVVNKAQPLRESMGPFDSYDERDAMRALAAEERAADDAGIDAMVAAAEPKALEEAMMPVHAGHGAFEIDAILTDVDAYLSPIVRKALEQALLPVVQSANKPVVTKTIEVEKVVEKIVHVGAGGGKASAQGAAPLASPGRKVEIGKLFGFGGSNGKKLVTMWDSTQAPAIDRFYVVNPLNMALFGAAIERQTNVWLTGPSGSGKTTMPLQFAARVGRPVVKFSFTRQSEVAPLIGGLTMSEQNGATVTQWSDGELIRAMRQPGTIIVLDELTFAPAGVQAIVQGTADSHRSYTVAETGEVVHAAPGVVFVVADNTRGYGDMSGQYHGTNQSNAALVNRFGLMLVIDYMDKADEARALVNHTGIAPVAASHLVEFVHRARRMPEMENIVLSLRQMVAFTNVVQDGFDAKTAAQVTILSRLPVTERAALETLMTLTWANEFAGHVTGTPAEVQPTASSSYAAQAFDDGLEIKP